MGNERLDTSNGEGDADVADVFDDPVQDLVLQRSEDQRLELDHEYRLPVFIDHSVFDLVDLEYRYEVAILNRAGAQKRVEPCDQTCC